MTEKKRGGKRKGSGRKSLGYKSKIIRVPLPVLDKVKQLIANFKAKHK